MRRALRVVAASTVLVAAVAAPAQLVPSALAAGGDHGASHEPASGSGSEKKSGGGGVGSTVNKVTCGAQNIVNRVTLGFFGSPCSSSSGSVDPVQATSSILKQTFGGLAVAASPLLTGTLTQVPDFASQSGGVVALERSTTAIGFAVAALVLTLSILRFALAGVSASGGFEGAEGVTRTVAAALAMLAWPWAFHNLAALMNTVTHALLSTNSVHVALLGLVAVGGFGAVLFATHSKIGWIFGIVILGLEALLMIGLLLMKVLLAGATTLIFVAMPLALALWPLRETSWIAGRHGARAVRRGRDAVDVGADLRHRGGDGRERLRAARRVLGHDPDQAAGGDEHVRPRAVGAADAAPPRARRDRPSGRPAGGVREHAAGDQRG